MSKEVKRYVATRTLPAASDWNSSTVPHTYVRAADYDALLAERDRLKLHLASTVRYIDTGDMRDLNLIKARAALQGEQP